MNSIRLLALTAAAISLSGCALTSDARILQSQFSFPNSDLEPAGHVHSELSVLSWFNPPVMDKAIWDKLTSDAMAQKGGDIVIDFVITSKLINYPIFLTKTTYVLDGTAVRVGGGGPGRQGIQ